MAKKAVNPEEDIEQKYDSDPELEIAIKEDEVEEKKLETELKEINDDDIKLDSGYDETEALSEFDEEEAKEEKTLDSELRVSGELKENSDDDDIEASEDNAGKFEDFYDFKKRYILKKV